MNEELRRLYEQTLKETIEGLDELAQGSEEREKAIKEIETLSKVLNEDFKNQQMAWDNEQTRIMDENVKMAQVAADKERSRLELAKGIGSSVVAGTFGFFGAKSLMKFIYKMDGEGILGNREAMKILPRFKFW